jgi:hypothetical protein
MAGVAKTARLPLFIVAAILASVTVVVAVPTSPAVNSLDILNPPCKKPMASLYSIISYLHEKNKAESVTMLHNCKILFLHGEDTYIDESNML